MSNTLAFRELEPGILEKIARELSEESFPEHASIISEGDKADRLFLLTQGRAEVTTQGSFGPALLATLREGEIFGELAFLSEGGERQATVTALTPVRTLVLNGSSFQTLLTTHPDLKRSLTQIAEVLAIEKFLKTATPFTRLDPLQAKRLAQRLRPMKAQAGESIVEEGQTGQECFLIRKGTVEIIVQEGKNQERKLGTLEPGMLFGEAALLTESPRNATVRALQPCELLVLQRRDLVEVIGLDSEIRSQIFELLGLRERPKQEEGILTFPRKTPDGHNIVTLKNPQRGTYYRLSEEGWFLWQRLDGRHTLRDLTLEYMAHFKAFAPEAIAQDISGLMAAGFITRKKLQIDILKKVDEPSWGQRFLKFSSKIVDWRITLKNVDPFFTRVYARGISRIFTPSGQILMALASVVGLVAFFSGASKSSAILHESALGTTLLFLLIPANFLATAIHEAGHALTTKAFGREIRGVGIGFYWFNFVAFVDTSDMWLTERWPRVAVSLAGPYANFFLGSLSSLCAILIPHPTLCTLLWLFALAQYLMFLINLNPLIEFDGYYVLMDTLEKPNLRRHSLEWLLEQFPKAVRDPRLFKGHWTELCFGAACIGYVVLVVCQTVILYRLVMQDIVAQWIPNAWAASLAWILGGLTFAVCIASILNEVKGIRAKRVS